MNTPKPPANVQKGKSRKEWIDNLRGFCMLAILLDHTEIYYTGANLIDYNLYVCNVLAIFFVLAGYLMYKPEKFDIKYRMVSLFRTLLVPYFIFTSLICLPKAWAHGNDIDVAEIVLGIATGQASWFVAALCLSEVIFSLMIWAFRGNCIAISVCSVCGFALSACMPAEGQPYFWQFDNAMQALLFLDMGYLYHRNEVFFSKLQTRSYTLLLFLLLACVKIYGQCTHADMIIWYINVTNYPLFIADITICTLLFVQLFKMLPTAMWLNWMGRHSLVYYFFCGGVPLLVSKLFIKAGMVYSGNYLLVVIALILVYLATTFIAFIVYRYFPFLVGKKRGS